MKKKIKSLFNPSFIILIKNKNNLYFLIKNILLNDIIFPLKILYILMNFFIFSYIFLLQKRLKFLFIIILFWNYFRFEVNYNLLQINRFKFNLLKIEFKSIDFIFNIKSFQIYYKIIFKKYVLKDICVFKPYYFIEKIIWFLKQLIIFLKKIIGIFLPSFGMGLISENKYFLLIYFLDPFLNFAFLNWNFLLKKMFLNELQIHRKSNLVFLEIVLKKKLLEYSNNFFFNTISKNLFFIKNKTLEEKEIENLKKNKFFFKIFSLLKNLIIFYIIFFYQAFFYFILFFLCYFFFLYFNLILTVFLISYEFKKNVLNDFLDYFF